jgi:hypothetical protein
VCTAQARRVCGGGRALISRPGDEFDAASPTRESLKTR